MLTPWLAPVPVLLIAAAASSAIGGSFAKPSGTALLLTAAAVPLAPALAWVVLAVGALAVLSIPARPAEGDLLADLQRQLDRCRRNGDQAYVLVASVPEERGIDARGIREVFRLTDTVEVRRGEAGYNVRSVVGGDDNFSPAGLQQRMEGALGESVSVGWARFPDAGATLDVLAESAWANATAVLPTDTRVGAASGPGAVAEVA